MFKKILVPVDLSEKHQAALQKAADLASQGNGEVVLFHVVEVIAGLSLNEEKDFYQRLEKKARAHLDHLGQQLSARKVSWHSAVQVGNRGPEIIRHAGDIGADLLILTAPRFDPSNLQTSWGSLSYKVVLFAPCPVLLVK